MGDQFYTIMTINIGPQTSKGPGRGSQRYKDLRDREIDEGRTLAAKRREIVVKKIRQEKPDIIAVQEQNYKSVRAIAEEMTNSLQDVYHVYLCKQVQDHAAILAKRDKFDDIEKIEFDSKFDADELLSRLILARIFPKEVNKRAFIAGSWHGRNTGTDSERVESIWNLVKTVTTMGTEITIGGDFNLARSKFPPRTDWRVAAAGDEKIDYFIFHGYLENFGVTDVKASVYVDANGIADTDAIAFLDHTPYIGRLTIPARSFENAIDIVV